MSETKQSILYKLKQQNTGLNADLFDGNESTAFVRSDSTTTFTSTAVFSGLPEYADKATAEAALAIGQPYINTTTGALCVALA